ncbi:MAG: dicarboxylate/amino acid:cation symporter [Bdellovibrionales bacterium]|nr:dicarboxylate/amino acid:cation symporter [Bdellovibrionales bacterium]
MSKKLVLTILILAGLVLGVLAGQLLFDPAWKPSMPQSAHASGTWLAVFEFLGFTIFMGLLKMLIIPLVLVSVIVGVTSVGDFRTLGRLGAWTLIYYFATMLIAVTIGLILVTYFEPGAAMGEAQLSQAQQQFEGEGGRTDAVMRTAEAGIVGVFSNLFKLMIPSNIIQAMAEGQTLGVILFGIFFGVITTMIGKQGEIIVEMANAVFEVLMKMVEVVLYLAPIGVFALLAWTVARIGLGIFGESIGVYMLTVVLGLFLHGFVVLPLILYIFTRSNPFRYMHQMRDALMTAFATDSSSATLPVTMDCATSKGGVSDRVSGLVLPLGSTVNMDGTALYEAVAVVFLAQAFNVDLALTQLVLIAITATLAAVGAAGIPSAGLVTMVIVVQATNQSLLAANPAAVAIPVAGVGLIIGVDRILDMVRTTVNVWGDAVGAKLIDSRAKATGI